jgi:DNA-binding response OmpR family regulator
MARPADRSSLVAAAVALAEQARVLTEEAERLRDEHAALVQERAELLALLTAVSHALRVTGAGTSRNPPTRHGACAWRFDRAARRVLVDTHEIPLSPRESDLLCYLLTHPGQSLNSETLLQAVWPPSFRGDRRTVRVHLSTMRAKLEPFGLPFRITTLHGSGYRVDGLDTVIE